MNEDKKEFTSKVKEKAEQIIEDLLNKEELSFEEIKIWYEVVDIHKDMTEEEEMKMRYNDYGARGVPGTGRYRDSYGRRGVPGSGRRYRGEDALEEMNYHYGNYHDSNNYGAKEDSTYKMIECFKDFGYEISQELEPQEKEMFKQAMQEIMQEL